MRAGETGLFEVVDCVATTNACIGARAILQEDTEAEDVTQQAFVNAYRHLDQFAGRAKFSTWLTRIAVHEALARARRRGRFDEQETVDDGDGDAMDALKSPGPDPERRRSPVSSAGCSNPPSRRCPSTIGRCSSCAQSKA